jgi:hypothetical protein
VQGGEGTGSGPQTDKNLPQSPFAGKFFKMTFCIAFYKSLSLGKRKEIRVVNHKNQNGSVVFTLGSK